MDPSESETMNLDWEEELSKFQNAMASGIKFLKVEAMNKLSSFSKHAPEHVLSRAIHTLTEILGQNIPNDHVPSLQEAAAYCLKCIACSRDGGGLAIQMAALGARVSLIRLLPHSEGKMQENLIKLLLALVTFCDTTRRVVAVNGGLEIVINLLNSPTNGNNRQDLLEIFTVLASQQDGRTALSSRLGDLHLFVEAAGIGSMISRERACKTIEWLAMSIEAARQLVEFGAIPVLVELLRDGDQTTKLIAADSLHTLSLVSDCNTRLVTQAGAIPLLAELLQGPDPSGKVIAKGVLSELAEREGSVAEIVGQLVRILREGDDESKDSASYMMWDLSCNENSSPVIRDSAAIPILVDLLGSGTEAERVMENVCMVFVNLSNGGANRIALAEAGLIPILMDLLRRDTNEELRDNVVRAALNFYEDPLHHDRVSLYLPI